MMEAPPSHYEPPFSRYTKILSKNGTQSFQKWCHLNFEDGFELGDLANPHNCRLLQIEGIQ